MTGLLARRAWPKPRRRVGRGHEPRNFVPRLARCSVFKDRFAPARKESLQAVTIRPEGDHRVYRPRPLRRAFSARSGHSQALVAAFTDLEHLTVELGRGDVEPSGLQHSSADPDSPLVDQAARPAARKVEVLGQ